MSIIFNQAPANNSIRYSKKLKLAVSTLVVVHFFGALGLIYPASRPYFEAATPINLLLTVSLLLYFHTDWNASFWLFTIITYFCGYFVEVLGVHTEFIFGSYAYGNTLGFQVWQVPLIIGVNWLILVYASGSLVSRLKIHVVLKSLLGATLMVLLDMLIEPVAIKLDFWDWADGIIPTQNYLGWFIVALFLQFAFHLLIFKKENSLAKFVLLVQAIFFIVLQTTI